MESNKSYYEYVRGGMELLLHTLAPFVGDEMRRKFGASYWWQMVLSAAPGYAKNFLPAGGEDEYLESKMDIELCLNMIDRYWADVFQERLRIKDYRTYTNELIGVRNNISHMGSTDLDQAYAERALDTMHRLCVRIDVEAAAKIKNLYKEVRAGTAPSSPDAAANQTNLLAGALPSWRDVMIPHDDVAGGNYKKAEFAADLSQVAQGKGSREYRDPIEFFARTFVTEGMKNLLTGALNRVMSGNGAPVVQLKTAFGGGKTHSMLALYHMMKHSDVITADNAPNLREVFDAVGIERAPKVNVATFVGTAENPAEWKRPKDFPGITINTMWGNIAYQLAKSAGRPEAYGIVKESDKKGVSPGSDALAELFDMCGPCLVLVDELVAYGRKIYRPDNKDMGLPAGTFENFTSFVQELSEGAKKSRNSLVVATIPESNKEIGGVAGQETLKTIEHCFGRLEEIWKPVTAEEGYEIVRRRLFHECAADKVAMRNHICQEFYKMYRDNPNDFPAEVRELDYRDKMVKCYPIHPEIFDRLYNDWSTLEDFQRTRGVLRLMAAVIHDLWSENDASPMIMPGSIPIGESNVRDELIRYLPGNWSAIVDRDVDGYGSVPRQIDGAISRFGQLFAARRVARTIMLGSAPSDKRQKEAVRGISKAGIRLGVVIPGQSISVYNDVLSDELLKKLIYLYSNQANDRFWYDTRPSLRKTAEDRAKQQSEEDVAQEIKRRLRNEFRTIKEPFGAVHICPTSPSEVADDQCARLVILGIGEHCKRGVNIGVSKAQAMAQEIFESVRKEKDTAVPRLYKNMLIFIAPDSDGVPGLTDAVKMYLAWQSIKDDREALNLDAQQNREADSNIKNNDNIVNATMCRVWQYLLIPSTKASDLKSMEWEILRLGDADSIMKKVLSYVTTKEIIIESWSPFMLRHELDNLLWRGSDHIQIRKLWEDLCSYCYLPRLSKYEVLERCVREGMPSGEYFGLAAGITKDENTGAEKYVGLKFNEPVNTINKTDYLVKPDAIPVPEPVPGPAPIPQPVRPQPEPEPDPIVTPTNTKFFMTANIDKLRGIRDFSAIFENIIEPLSSDERCKLLIKLDVEARDEKGIPADIVRAVKENCDELNRRTKEGERPKIEYYNFED